MKLKVKNFLRKNNDFIRYVIVGMFLTILGPSIFLFSCNFFPPNVSIFFSEFLAHSLRFYLITGWVFKSIINRKSLIAYLKGTTPIISLNIILVNYLTNILDELQIAIIISFFSATIGFIWNKFCFANAKK